MGCASVRVPVHEWSNVRTEREIAKLMHEHLVGKVEARDAIIAALLQDAAMHEAGSYGVIGRDYGKLESLLPCGPDPDLRAIGIAMTFWDSWIDARNHQWRYHRPIAETDWPQLARSIATDLSEGWNVRNPVVLANFDLLNRPTLGQRVTKLLDRITSALRRRH